MSPIVRARAGPTLLAAAFLAAGGLALGGCAASSPPAAFPLPPRPAEASPRPERPPLVPGDVIAGRLEGEAAPRACFRAEAWGRVLNYVLELEARAERLERQIREMNRGLRAP